MKQNNKREAAIADLTWLFWKSEADFGIRSNHSVFIDACLYSTKELLIDRDTLSEIVSSLQEETIKRVDPIKAATKYRKIMAIYKKLSTADKVFFEKYYEPRQYSSDICKLFKDGACSVSVIPMTETGKEISRLDCILSRKTLLDKCRAVCKQLNEEIAELYNNAINHYIEQKDLYENVFDDRACKNVKYTIKGQEQDGSSLFEAD